MQRLKGNCGISVREFPLFLPLASPHSLLWACFWLIGCHVLAIRRTQWRWGTPVHIPYHKCLSCSLLISCILIKESEWILFFFTWSCQLSSLRNGSWYQGFFLDYWIMEVFHNFFLVLHELNCFPFILLQENTLQGKEKLHFCNCWPQTSSIEIRGWYSTFPE